MVGPNPRAAFRFAKDYIEDGSKFCFRKHQVWVRNDDTSDIATPEQIVALASRRAPHEPQILQNTIYSKLAHAEQGPTLRKEAKALFTELGFQTSPAPTVRLLAHSNIEGEFRVRFQIRRKRFVFRCCVRESMTRQMLQAAEVCKSWHLEHGLLVILAGAFSKSAKVRHAEVDFDAPWGNLTLLHPTQTTCLWMGPNIPKDFSDIPTAVITLPRIADTRSLRQAVTSMLHALDTDDALFSHLERARSETNKELKRWSPLQKHLFAAKWPTSSSEELATFRRCRDSVLRLIRKDGY